MYKKVDDILNALKDGTLKVAKLSKETGIPSSRMYKWKDRGSKITSQDAELLDKWLNFSDKFPLTNKAISSQAGDIDKIHQPVGNDSNELTDLRAKTLYSISESNRNQSEANKLQAEANKIQAKNNEDLLQALKATGYAQEHIPVAVSASFAGILGVIADIGMGKKMWKSKEEALAVLHKFVPLPESESVSTGIHASSDK